VVLDTILHLQVKICCNSNLQVVNYCIDVEIVSQVGSFRWVSTSFVSIPARSRERTSLGGHRCGAGHRVFDGKVSEWNEREATRTRKYQCFNMCTYQMYLV